MRQILGCVAGVFLSIGSAGASECRQSLVLGLDVSSSVDAREYRLQLDGLAEAILDHEVADALLASPEYPIYFSVFEWSDRTFQREILGWTALRSHSDLANISGKLKSWRRVDAPATTGLGAAMEYGSNLLRTGPACDRLTLDISGDGKNNDWPRPRDFRNSGQLVGITINALVIGNEVNRPAGSESGDVAELTAYFQQEVILGPGSFTEVALGFEDYASAMRRKLLREVATIVLGQASPHQIARQ